MVAKITTPLTVNRALNYNEKKVQKGVAKCLFAGNFLRDASTLSFHEKLARFTRLNALNNRAKTNTLHISLNFDPTEKIGQEKLVQIAAAYMAKIGFGHQPYLVYEHRDAGHPHLHIVTTSIQENGTRIDTYNIGKNQSQKARTEIEESFGLVKATGHGNGALKDDETATVKKIRYGKTATKQAITNVLDFVLHRYHYTSLPELNAVLKLYNLVADRGAEGSRTFQNGGLTYRVLDEAGNKTGVPLKASSIYFKPTLRYLTERFGTGEDARKAHRQKLKTAIDFRLRNHPRSLADLVQRLGNEKITVVPRQNSEGFLYGITFIDHRTRCVFNGSDLGKDYSAAALQKRFSGLATTAPNRIHELLGKKKDEETSNQKTVPAKEQTNDAGWKKREAVANITTQQMDLFGDLLKAEKDTTNVPYAFKKKKKKGR